MKDRSIYLIALLLDNRFGQLQAVDLESIEPSLRASMYKIFIEFIMFMPVIFHFTIESAFMYVCPESNLCLCWKVYIMNLIWEIFQIRCDYKCLKFEKGYLLYAVSTSLKFVLYCMRILALIYCVSSFGLILVIIFLNYILWSILSSLHCSSSTLLTMTEWIGFCDQILK